MVVVDTTQASDQVRREVVALIGRGYLSRQAGLRVAQTRRERSAYMEGSVS
jgi:hypothetical protein